MGKRQVKVSESLFNPLNLTHSAVAEAAYASEPTGLSVMVNAAQALTPNLLRPTSNLVKVLADAGLMARTGALADPNVPRDLIEIRVGRNRNPT